MTSDDYHFEYIEIGDKYAQFTDWLSPNSFGSAYTVRLFRATLGNILPPRADISPDVHFRSGKMYQKKSSRHCTYDQSDCWTLRVHPFITGIDYFQSNTNGGGRIKIRGESLDGTDYSVTIGGIPCIVKPDGNSNYQAVHCHVGQSPTPTVEGTQPFVKGLRF